MTGVITTRLLGCSLALALSPQTWEPYLGVPPSELSSPEAFASSLRFPSDEIRGDVAYTIPGKKIRIIWTHLPSETDLLQQFATSFWPTAVATMSDERTLVVAGKRRNGNTLIETWSMDGPTFVPDGEGSLLPGEVSSKESIYDAAVEGRDMVKRMVHVVGNPNALLVQFWDSKDLYVFNLSGTIPIATIVASPNQGQPPAMYVPRLAEDFTDIWAASHTARGYVYVFAGVENPLVLVDANRDGAIESFQTVTASEWNNSDWSDHTQYTHL